MRRTRLTLLVEDLVNLAGANPAGKSFPSIESVLTRGRFRQAHVSCADGQRMSLFGLPSSDVPVAALTRLADGGEPMPAGRYWLRADAVSQQADMIRVFMTGAGFEGLSQSERQEISGCIEQVFEDEGLDYSPGHDGRWALAMKAPPGFNFLPLEDALGLDMAEALPAGQEARNWRRIMNETQVALHNHPVNIRKRQSGQVLINGVWIWGGGFLPVPAADTSFDTVFSTHPVSRGLALLNKSELQDLGSFDPALSMTGGQLFLDWTVESRDAAGELDRLETLFHGLLRPLRNGNLSLVLAGPAGETWEIDRKAMRRFWRRPAPLQELIGRLSS